jgi:hypothetical protein
VESAEYDTVLAVFNPECATELACNDDVNFPDTNSALGIVATEGDELIFAIDGFDDEVGAFQLDIVQNASPGGDCCAEDVDGGCSDNTIETCVCDLDSDCCDTQWTAECANLAMALCDADCTPA